MAEAHPRPKDRPVVLLVLQGAHHLDLFHAVLTRCPAFDWVCLIHGLDAVPPDALADLHDRHGVRVFTDIQTAILQFGDLDAMVTTFALPHRAHLPYLGLIALAQELGLPVFELQHGLFQQGLSFQSDGVFVGSGRPGAQDGLATRNLTDAVLPWWGAGAVGYPPFHAGWRGVLADGIDDAEAGSEFDPVPARAGCPVVAVYTNLHWSLLTEDAAGRGYALLAATIRALPDVTFVLAPHPTEAASGGFLRMRDGLQRRGAANLSVCAADDTAGRRALMARADLAVATASSVLLDLEMRDIPVLLLGLPAFEGLYAAFERACVIRGAAALTAAIAALVDDPDAPRPILRTGRLVPFDPETLQARIAAALPDTGPRPRRDVVPILYRYAREQAADVARTHSPTGQP